MLKKILLILAAIFAGFIIFVASQPSKMKVERSIKIVESPRKIYAYVNSQVKWEEWSPWANLDPNAEKFFGGTPEGVGSYYRWKGNDSVGAGTSTIVENKQDEFVKLRLDFEKPMQGTYFAEFKFVMEEDGTQVTWAMYGKRDFLSKIVGLFIDCDTTMGGEFEKGLKNLKAVTERN